MAGHFENINAFAFGLFCIWPPSKKSTFVFNGRRKSLSAFAAYKNYPNAVIIQMPGTILEACGMFASTRAHCLL